MPQLLPFYFLNQICFTFFALGLLIYLFSKYILPTFVQLFISRMYISTLLLYLY